MSQHTISTQKKNFSAEYERLCILHDSCPLPHVTVHLKEEILDFNADRICSNEWDPILGALQVNNSLKCISIKSVWQPFANEKQKKLNQKKTPAIRSRDLSLRLLRAMKDCLCKSEFLHSVTLVNIPLRERDISYLAKGVSRSKSLKHFSLQHSRMCDELFEGLCKSFKKSQTVLSIDFTGCGLTWKSAEIVANIIKYQATKRHGEAWQESLRYRRPDLDQMHGLRRITLNENKIGDIGARILADALKDDLWLKALDLQKCAISNEGAQVLHDSLLYNKALNILDLRGNNQISNDILRSIIEKVLINAGGESGDYKWNSVNETINKDKSCCKRLAKFSTSKRCVRKNMKREHLNKRSSEHYPWRTEERNRSRRKPSLNCTYTEPKTAIQSLKKNENGVTLTSFGESSKQNITVKKDVDKTKYEIIDSTDTFNEIHREVEQAKSKSNMLEELEFYKINFEKERKQRIVAENRFRNLEQENKSLLEDLQRLQSAKTGNPGRDEVSNRNSNGFNQLQLEKGVLDDEKVLESIETSFQHFQQFLDMLKNLGLGDLYNQMLLQQPKE